jgi:hypothetical protein
VLHIRRALLDGQTPPTLAGECADLVVPAVVAAAVQETELEQAAAQVLSDLRQHELRQTSGLLGPLHELPEVRGQRLMQHRLFRSMADEGLRTEG